MVLAGSFEITRPFSPVHGSPETVVSVWSNDYATSNITITDGSQGVGTRLTVQLNITDAPSFNGFELRLSYDPAFLYTQASAVDVRSGTLFGDTAFAPNLEVQPGEVLMAVVNLGGSFSGNGALAQITFTVQALGVSPLGLSHPKLVLGATLLPTPILQDGYFRNIAGKLGPVASFTFTPPDPLEGDSVIFDASASFDADNATGPTPGVQSYWWDFADGLSQSVHEPIIAHTFVFLPGSRPIFGNFSVRLIVTDFEGFSGFRHQIIEVEPRPPPPPLCSLGRLTARVPTECPTIDSAIDAVVPGGTVTVDPGTYHENLIINKPMTLQGSNPDDTVLDGGLKIAIEIIAPDVRVSGLQVVNGGGTGALAANIVLLGSNRTVIMGNVIGRTPSTGAFLVSGIKVIGSSNVMLHNNRIENGTIGIALWFSPNSALTGNKMAHNAYSFTVSGNMMEEFVQNVDDSNTIDGKPIYYAVGARNPQVPLNPGYLAFIQSQDVNIGPVTVANVGQGLLLAGCSNIAVRGLTATNVGQGIVAFNSTGITVEDSVIGSELSQVGIRLLLSHNNRISTNTITTRGVGIALLGSNVNSVFQNRVEGTMASLGLTVEQSQENTIEDNVFSSFRGSVGIAMLNSPLNTFSRNQIAGYIEFGIGLIESPSNFFDGNLVHGGEGVGRVISSGIVLINSPRNVLKSNQVRDAFLNLHVRSDRVELTPTTVRFFRSLADYVQQIDTTNTFDDKHPYYLVNERHRIVPPNAGYVAIVNSTDITVSNTDLAFSGDGVLIASSTNIRIENNRVSFARNGIFVWASSNVMVRNNWVSAIFNGGAGISVQETRNSVLEGNVIRPVLGGRFTGSHGILLFQSNSVTVRGNYATDYAFRGIELADSNNNTIERNTFIGTSPFNTGILISFLSKGNMAVGNTMAFNGIGIQATNSHGNTFYHNNFIQNHFQATGDGNAWDNGRGEGNFWNDYQGEDLDGDGVGDTLLPQFGLDNHPLIQPWAADGLNGAFSGRGAWPELRRYSISRDEDPFQALYAKVIYTGERSGWVQAVFTITSSAGTVIELVSDPVWTEKGETVTLSVFFLPSSLGSYSVSVQAQVSSDAFFNWHDIGWKSFTFTVVP